MRVAVLFGGPSPEHKISCLSAHQVLSAIDVRKYAVQPIYVDRKAQWWQGEALWQKGFSIEQLTSTSLEQLQCDVALPVFHGPYGEDGVVQALLEAKNIPIAGCSHTASALAMDKVLCKRVVASLGIATLPDFVIELAQMRQAPLLVKEKVSAYPVFVKPRRLGSSIGIGRVEKEEELLQAVANGLAVAEELMVEPCVEQLMEINVAVLNGRASCVEVPVPTDKVLTYEDKYERGGKGKIEGMASLTRVIDPPDLDEVIKNQVQDSARRAYALLGCNGCVRFDFMLDLADDTLYFNELNPIPGSLAFYLWEKGDDPKLFTEILDEMITSSI